VAQARLELSVKTNKVTCHNMGRILLINLRDFSEKDKVMEVVQLKVTPCMIKAKKTMAFLFNHKIIEIEQQCE
jgi:hypothetical protein